MTSSIVKKVLDRLEGEKELKILESNNEIKQPKLWARAKELAEERHKVYSPDAHGWAIRWYQQKGGVFNCLVDEEVKEELLEKKWISKDGKTKYEFGTHPSMKPGAKRPKSKVKPFKTEYDPSDDDTFDPHEAEATRGQSGKHANPKGKMNVRKKYPVKEEKIEEVATTRIPAQNGNVYELMYTWRGKGYYCKMFFPNTKKPSTKEVQIALNQVYPSATLKAFHLSAVDYGDPYIHAGTGDGFTDK